MDTICTACLCIGRKLYFIGETGSYNVYSQILNEIPVYDLSHVCVRVCWECRALLHRFGEFKARVKASYSLLLQHLHQNIPPSQEQLVRPSRLNISSILTIDYPLPVKLELDTDDDYLENVDPIKHESMKLEPDDDMDAAEFDLDTSEFPYADDRVAADDEAEAVKNEDEIEIKNDEVIVKKSDKKALKEKKKKHKTKVKGKKSVRKKKDENKTIQSDIEELKQDKIDNYSDMDCDNITNNKEERIEEGNRLESVLKKKEAKKRKEPQANGQTDKIPEIVGNKPKCPECGKLFSSKKTYRYHMNTLHKGQNKYPCPRCGKVYQWKSNLGRHMRSHKAVDSGELYCKACDKRFASVATYRQHLRISRSHVTENEFRFKCNDCGKKFVNKIKLRDHIDWEHLQKVKFRCQLCNKPFKCHTSLYVHMQNVHNHKSKENLCHICGKSYQNAAKLKYHIVAMHTSETPYRCALCRAAFGWYSSLYRHLREVHHNVKHKAKKMKIKRTDGLPVLPHELMHTQPGPAPV